MAEYIDREAIVLKYEFGMVSDEGIVCIPYRDIKKSIANTPFADVVEVKHGEWQLLEECSNEGVYCSVCHKKVYRKDYANQKIKSKYCPNCGARMDGDNNA